jgi:uncharacterized protein (TIGR02391 family)
MMNLETKLESGLWDAVRETFEARNFTNAILDAMYFLSDLLRERSGVESDGVTLVGEAFGGSSPKLKINALQTESDKNVQKGVEQLLRGMYQAIRNPRSHGKIADTEDDAQAIILFVNYIVKLVGQSKTPFSKSTFLARVFDPDFVASKRYAELIVNEIPARKRLEVFLDVYRLKLDTKAENLKIFFAALFEVLQEDDKATVYEAISEDLQQADDETTIRTIIQIFDPELWLKLDEAARLRTENKLIRSIISGRYIPATKKFPSGSLGTWAPRLFAYFTLKNEALSAILNKLASADRAEQDYGFRVLHAIDALTDAPPKYLESLLMKGIQAGDPRFHDAATWGFLWENEKWNPELKTAIEKFKEVETDAEPFDDDIPF